MEDIVILDGVRTPMAEYNGVFSDISAIDLAVHASREALSRSGTEPGEIDHVIFGNALQTSGDAIYGARHVGPEGGHSQGSARLDRQPAVRLGFRIDRPGFPPDPPRGGPDRPGRRHGEHVAGSARHSRRAPGAAPRPGEARGFPDGGASRLLQRPLHGPDLRPRGGEIRSHPPGTGRLRPLLPAARCGRAGLVPPLRGDRSRRDQGRPQDRARREGRPRPAGHDPGGPRRAAPLLRRGEPGHGRQRVGDRGRGRRRRRDLRRPSAREGEEAPRTPGGVGRRGVRARADGPGSRSRRPRRAGPGRPQDGGHRSLGDQRGLRGADPGRRPRARPRSGEVERQRGSDRSRAPAGRDRHAVHADASEGTAGAADCATASPGPASAEARASPSSSKSLG